MGVELRRGRPYLYDRQRNDRGKLVKIFRGALSEQAAEVHRGLIAERKRQREQARLEVRLLSESADAVLAAGDDCNAIADCVFQVTMCVEGYSLHSRGEWRQKRGGPMSRSQIAEMEKRIQELRVQVEDRVRPPIVQPVSHDSKIQKILDRASRGDAEVIPQVRELLNDSGLVASWGAVGTIAQKAIVHLAANRDLVVREAMERKFEEYLANLLADVGPNPTFAEKLAASRAANNWLMVNVLEAMMSGYPARSKEALALDKRVTLAERRLHMALRSLATLHRLRRATRRVMSKTPELTLHCSPEQ